MNTVAKIALFPAISKFFQTFLLELFEKCMVCPNFLSLCCLFERTVSPLKLFRFPFSDIPLLRVETDAHFGDGAAVKDVFVGIATLIDLGEGGIG